MEMIDTSYKFHLAKNQIIEKSQLKKPTKNA
jgi:hypothetical protein